LRCKITKFTKGAGRLFCLGYFLFSLDILWSKPPGYEELLLESEALLQLQRTPEKKSLDQGSVLEVQHLLHELRAKYATLIEQYGEFSQEFNKAISTSKTLVQADFGEAFIQQLGRWDGSAGAVEALAVVRLRNFDGEPIEVLIADLKRISPESADLNVLIAQKLQYEPTDETKKHFGKSLMLVDADWVNETLAGQALGDENKQLYFEKGSNLAAWLKATFHKPKLNHLSANNLNTSLQLCGTAVACSLADHLGVSQTPMYIPIALSVIWSSIIGMNIESYAVLSRMGSYLKRFTFNFFATSMSFAVTMVLWSKTVSLGSFEAAVSYLMHPETLFWLAITGIAGNSVRFALDKFVRFREDVRLTQGPFSFMGKKYEVSKANMQSQLIYSFIANPLRLMDLFVQSVVRTENGGSEHSVRIAVKSFYLFFATSVSWMVTRYAEIAAAKAKIDANFSARVNVEATLKHAAHMRKEIEEFKSKVRKGVYSLVDIVLWRRVSDPTKSAYSIRNINELFVRWQALRSSYLFRSEHAQSISPGELAKYRAEYARGLAELLWASRDLQPHGTSVDEGRVRRFVMNKGHDEIELIRESFLEMRESFSDDSNFDLIREHASLLEELLREMNLRIQKSRVGHEADALLSSFFDMVDNFKNEASIASAEYLQHMGDFLGAYAGKNREHYKSRLALWRYLYKGDSVEHSQRSHFFSSLKGDFSSFEEWAKEQVSLLDTSLPSYQKKFAELKEFMGLASELRTRAGLRAEEHFKQWDLEDQSFLNRFDRIMKEELLAFKALSDFRDRFETRWSIALEKATATPEPLWTYQRPRGAELPPKPRGKLATGLSSCMRQLGFALVR
jgi:hypothetical protein